MAIDLPPAVPPQLTSAEALRSSTASGMSMQIAGYDARIAGATLVSEEEIRTALGSAADLSQAVRALSALYRLKGYLAARILYVLDGTTLLVQVNEGCIRAVEAPPRLQGYLDPLIGDCALTTVRFHQQKLLADLLTDRAGQSVSSELKFEDGANATLFLNGNPLEDHDPTQWSLNFGNPGNRFLGRYFAGGGVRHHTRRGTELTATYNRALTSMGSSPQGGKYLNAYQAGAGFVQPWGLIGTSASYVEYEQEVLGFDLEADVLQLEVAGQYLLPSRPEARWLASGRLLYVDSQIEEPISGLDLQDEVYPAIEAGTAYNHGTNIFSQSIALQGGLLLRQGLGDQDGSFPVSGRRGDFTLMEPNVGLTWNLKNESELRWTLNAQITSDSLPQQQQWVLGGISNMSAWLPGVLIGDQGLHTRLEYSLAPIQLREQPLSLSVFAEAGSAEFEDQPAPLSDRRSLSDAGFRLNYQIWTGLTLDAVAALPLGDSHLDDDFLEDLRSDAFFNLRQVF